MDCSDLDVWDLLRYSGAFGSADYEEGFKVRCGAVHSVQHYMGRRGRENILYRQAGISLYVGFLFLKIFSLMMVFSLEPFFSS